MPYDKVELEHRGVSFGPPPDTFILDAISFGERRPSELADRGICFWLTQSQIDITGPERCLTYRSMKQVTGDEGLQAAARLDVDFNPQYQRIAFHKLTIHRLGEAIQALDHANIDILQRELNLERAIYDGRLTAHVVLNDVRVGDIVEVCYSITVSNPALCGTFAWWCVLQWATNVVETRVTLRSPMSRPVSVRRLAGAPDPVVADADGVRTLSWRVIDVEPYRTQEGSPLAFVGYQAVHMADAISWSQIADLFRSAYEPPQTLPVELQGMIADLAAAHPERGTRMVEGLRLVQRLLRYHSVGIGDGGYKPRSLDQILATRYGDCKDASRLLTTVLRTLSIDAVCALVSTQYGADLDQTPPNGQAFDHAIVRARIGSETYWLDPTKSEQAGTPETITQSDHSWALPLEADAKLQAIKPKPLLSVCETREHWTFAAERDAPARLNLETIYRGWRADGVRSWIANDGPASVERRWRESLEDELHSPLIALEAPEIQDDRDANILIVREVYDVVRPFQNTGGGAPKFISRDEIVGPHIKMIASGRRREPFHLGIPRHVLTTRRLIFPVPIAIAPWSETIEGPGGQRLETSLCWDSSTTAVHRLSYLVRERILAVSDAEDYRMFADKARQNNGITFEVPFEKGRMKAVSHGPGWRSWAIVIAVIAALALWRWMQV